MPAIQGLEDEHGAGSQGVTAHAKRPASRACATGSMPRDQVILSTPYRSIRCVPHVGRYHEWSLFRKHVL